MPNSLFSNKRVRILAILLLLILLTDIAVSVFIKQKLQSILKQNPITNYTVSVSDVSFKFIQRNITLKDIKFTPKSKALLNLMEKDLDKNNLDKISAKYISINNISFFDFLFHKEINIGELAVNGLKFYKFKNSESKIKKSGIKIKLDSIPIKDINGLEVKKFTFNEAQFESFDFNSNQITFTSVPLDLKMGGLKLTPNGKNYFKLEVLGKSFAIKGIGFDNIDYQFKLNSFEYDNTKNIWDLKKLSIHPKTDKFKLATTKKHNDDIIDVDIQKIQLYNFNIENLINGNGVFIDSVSLEKADITIFKDKRKPFNESKRPGLPHIKLKQLKLPLLIKNVALVDCSILVQEKLAEKDILMEVPINQINASISNVSSIAKYRKAPIIADINALLMKSGKIHAKASFNMQDNNHRFYFNGTLSKSKLELFDSALFPALGLKVIKGELDHLSFQGSANSISSEGSMTMLYHDLEAEIFKSNSLEENKFLSWGVNSLIHESNPKKGKEPREVIMQFERVPYKGLGNYFWKTIQSGLVNTLNPVGKKVKKKK
ncbi:hypothetical protein KH5_13740 [Urechidicola sp. KH5]